MCSCFRYHFKVIHYSVLSYKISVLILHLSEINEHVNRYFSHFSLLFLTLKLFMTLNLTLDDLELEYIFKFLIKVYNVRVNDFGITISLYHCAL